MSTTLKRIGVAVLVLAAVVLAMFAFGKPTTPQVPPTAASAEVVTSEADVAPVDGTGGTPDEGSDPLAVQIPGCVCHSDDPAVVEEHASYRMSECFDCHKDGMPEMGQ